MSSILVLFHSQEYGNTAAMAEAVEEGARAAGARVTLANTNEQRMDIEQYRGFDAAAFGSPDYYSYVAGGMKVFLDDWHIAKQRNAEGMTEKPYSLFYSHGGGGAVRGPLEELFGRMGTKVGDTVESKGKPTTSVIGACRNLGQALAVSLNR